MSEPLYLCRVCLDIGIVIRERKRSDGVSLGSFGSPCPHCSNGDEHRADWSKNGLRDAARANERAIDRMEDSLRSEEPSAELQRYRSAAKANQDRRDAARGAMRPLAGLDGGKA